MNIARYRPAEEEDARRVRNRADDHPPDDPALDAAGDAGVSLLRDPMRTEPKPEISPHTNPDQMIHIFKTLLENGTLDANDTKNDLKKSNGTLLLEAVKINMTLEAGHVTPEFTEIVDQMKKILIDGKHVTKLNGGRRRSSYARKSSSRRGRHSAKKRGTQRKQKRRQRRASRRIY